MQTAAKKKHARSKRRVKRSKVVARPQVPVPVVSEPETVTAFKGFDKDFKCRGFAFEVGKTYEHTGPVVVCQSGFHACEHPLHVFQYYRPGQSRFARVTMGGTTARHSGDSKISAARITIKAELSLSDFAAAAVKWVFAKAKWKKGPVAKHANEGVTASGDYGAATASGDYGAATASGYSGAATASGDSGAATASGYSGAATASGYYGQVSGKDGCALFLVERGGNRAIINVWAGIAGRDGIKPDVFYQLKNGRPVEV